MSVDNEEFEQRHRELLDNVEDAQEAVDHIKLAVKLWFGTAVVSAIGIILGFTFHTILEPILYVFGPLFGLVLVAGFIGSIFWVLEDGYESTWKDLRRAQRKLRDHLLKEL